MLGSVETLVMEGRAAGRFLASGASPEHAISLSIPRPPPHVQLWADKGITAWYGKPEQPSGRCLDVGALVPHIPLRIPPSHLYFAFQGQRSFYIQLPLSASLDLLRAGKVCLARSLGIDTLGSASGSFISSSPASSPSSEGGGGA